jgi:hypothetical protein
MDLTTSGQRLKQLGLNARIRKACTRVLQARLAALKTLFSHSGVNPVDPAKIDRAIDHFVKEERRRQRILDALTSSITAETKRG